jgi:excisionase family DNA binding protein
VPSATSAQHKDPRLQSLASVLIAKEQQNVSLLGVKWFRISEVAAALSVHVGTVRAWIHDGKISATRTGRGRFRVSAETLRELQGKGGV